MAKKFRKLGPYNVQSLGRREIRYAVPDWSDEDLPYVTWRRDKYFLDEFVRYSGNDELSKLGIQGIHGLTAFSGVGIKIDEYGDSALLYYFYT